MSEDPITEKKGDENAPKETTTKDPALESSDKKVAPESSDKKTTKVKAATGKTTQETIDEIVNPESKREDQTGPRNPLDELFSKKNSVEGIMGEPCEIPDLLDAEQRFLKTRCLIIAGFEPKHCCWAASRIADRGKFTFRYASDSVGTAALTTTEIVQALTRLDRPPTCLILNRTTFSDHRHFADAILRFETSVMRLRTTAHGLIVYVHPQAIERIVKSGGWPEHIARLEVPDRPPQSGTAGHVDSDQFLPEVFAPSARSTPQELIAAQNRLLIPRALVRLAVLFPNLSTTNFEILLKAVLQGQRVEIAPAKKKVEAKEGDAWNLWTIGRQAYEQQAGLMRATIGAARTLRFVSKEIEDNARDWVWRYPEELLSLFAAISNQRILFGEHLDDEEETLFRSYVEATVELAHRAPGMFGAKWLEALLQDFAGWVQDQTSELETPATDLFQFLVQLESQQKRRQFWARFTERMARLTGLLYQDRSGQVVEQFLERLTRHRLGELVLQIVGRMGDALSGEKRLDWIERMIKDNDSDVRAAAVRELAWQVLRHPDAAGQSLAKLRTWLETSRQEGTSRTFEAAVAFPAFLFDIAENKSFDPGQGTSPLLTALESATDDEQTVKDFCKAAMEEERFGRVAGRFLLSEEIPSEDQPFFAIALAIYQSALALPDAQQGVALELIDSAFKPLETRGQHHVRSWWKEFADQCAKTEKGINRDSPEGRRHRESLNRRYEIAKTLIRH
jgi:hypothetical protein